MHAKRFISLIALLLAMCTLFTACGGAAAEPTESTEPEEEVDIFQNSMQKSDPSQDEEFNVLLIGNTWRPNYELSEERIAALQQAAHEAVANMNN